MSSKFQSKKALRIWGITAAAVAVVSAALRLLSILFFYDTNIGYYKSGAILPIIAQALPAVAVVATLVFAVIPALRPAPVQPDNCYKTRSFAIFPAAGFSGYTVVYLIQFVEYLKLLDTIIIKDIMWDIIIALALIGASVFFWLIFLDKKIASTLYAASGLCVIVSAVYFLAGSYFDTLVQMNAPNKVVFQFALLAAMLLTVNEMRMGQTEKKPVFHLFTATAAVIYMLTSSLPSIICYFMGKMPLNYSLFYEDSILLMFTVFAFARLFGLCFGKKNTMQAVEAETKEEEKEAEATPTTDEE